MPWCRQADKRAEWGLWGSFYTCPDVSATGPTLCKSHLPLQSLMLEFLPPRAKVSISVLIKQISNTLLEATNTHKLKLPWRQFLHLEREVCSHLAGGVRGTPWGVDTFLERGIESLRVKTHYFMLVLSTSSSFPVSSLKKLSIPDTAVSNVSHGLFAYMLYLCFKCKFSTIYSRPGNN